MAWLVSNRYVPPSPYSLRASHSSVLDDQRVLHLDNLTLFTLDLNLTPEGLENYTKIIEAVFAYIGLVQEGPILDQLTKYLKDRRVLEYQTNTTVNQYDLAMSVAANMQVLDDQDIAKVLPYSYRVPQIDL